MKRHFAWFGLLVALLLGCEQLAAPPVAVRAPLPWPPSLPVYDHVVIVVEENKDYEQIIGNPAAPYINRLAAEGADLVRMFAEEHNSEGNYFWLFSGDNHNVGFHDAVPTVKFAAPNLGAALIARGRAASNPPPPRGGRGPDRGDPLLQGLFPIAAGDRLGDRCDAAGLPL